MKVLRDVISGVTEICVSGIDFIRSCQAAGHCLARQRSVPIMNIAPVSFLGVSAICRARILFGLLFGYWCSYYCSLKVHGALVVLRVFCCAGNRCCRHMSLVEEGQRDSVHVLSYTWTRCFASPNVVAHFICTFWARKTRSVVSPSTTLIHCLRLRKPKNHILNHMCS